jgi:hypothetical protein
MSCHMTDALTLSNELCDMAIASNLQVRTSSQLVLDVGSSKGK